MSESYGRSASSAGAMLTAAREELNLSVYDVARYLKISPAQVEALEEGAYERLPGRVFVRGFLRNYAKFLGMDAQPLLRSIEDEMPKPRVKEEPPPSPEVVMPREQAARWPLYTGFTAMAIVGALAVYEFGFNDTSRSMLRDERVTAASPSSPPASATASTPGTAAPVDAPSLSSAPPGTAPFTSPTAPDALNSPATSAVTDAPAALVAPPSPPLKPGERELAFKFEEESWVEVRDRDGKVVFSKLNRPGSEERVRAMPPLKIVIGNARSVHVTYDEQPVDLATHTGVSVARLTLQ